MRRKFNQAAAKLRLILRGISNDVISLTEAANGYPASNISYRHADFLAADLPEGAYDVIVAIASLHHMDLAAALEKIRRLLRSSGKLLVLGLYRETTLVDYAYSAISAPLNLVYLKWHRAAEAISTPTAPTRSPQLSLQQIAAIANAIIPGSRLQRHLFWRYSLTWRKP